MVSKHRDGLCVLMVLVSPAVYAGGSGDTPRTDVPDDAVQTFNPAFLRLSDGDRAQDIDLSYFGERGGQQPGEYRVDVVLNGQRMDTTILRFLSLPGNPGKLFACLSPDDLANWGIQSPVSAQANSLCQQPVSSLWPGASERLDLSKNQWLLTVPQKYLSPPGWLQVPPRLWQEGLPALLLNYDYNGYQQTNRGVSTNNQYLGLDGSLSVAGWRLRNQSNWTQQGGTSEYNRWTSLNTYLQRDYGFAQGGMLTAGQTYTSGTLFDSFSFTGIKAESDDGMLLQSLVTYSPIIYGIANSQAQVTVRQNGTIIYQKSVPPGPFELRDVNMLNSGDLQVEVREADGSTHRFTQVSASVPVLQREGRVRYSVSVGRYRNSGMSDAEEPLFMQGEVAVGLPADFTLYGGLMAAGDYTAGTVGAGRYSAWLGAFSMDVTQAQSRFGSLSETPGSRQGQSMRFAWARGIEATGTTLNLAGYRYATRGFYTFTEMQEQNGGDSRGTWSPHLHSRVQISATQPLGDVWGSFSLSGSRDNYWDETSVGQNWTASYSTSIAGVSLGMSLGLNRVPMYSRTDQQMTLNVSVPLSHWLPGNSNSVTSTTSTYNGRASSQLGLAGSAMDNRLSYSVAEGWQNQGGGETGSVGASWQGGYGQATGGYTWYQGGQQWSYGLRGGLAVHPHGITLSRTLSMDDGNALVMAPGAADVRIKNGTGFHTDWLGYAVVPDLTSYQRNQVSLDVSDLPENVDARTSDREVVPTRGALVATPFRILVGYRALITLRSVEGEIPLGASVTVSQGDDIIARGVVDNGQVYMSGLPASGTLIVNWQNGTAHHCQANYQVEPSYAGLSQITAVCR
ncbi:fimbrial biogenesis outer membrane usher protein [Salmonella enterica]|nr:fimbrial biogenesis outer membrane usher protein [Salmonella enterica]EGO9987219.1 fimbrial biogenesis outer membrane usher protein [Salmonella enterica]EIF5468778.1 fimbrial biogenesis outer membrane usher protein [Salmonella enterica]EII4302284.1 fimbrial biogenesis outer membrane usher protein [Salmonella enterica]EIM8377447.1 fimbrial biogenesis outer membrane usher protein [Salmonella enterica]